MTCFAFTANNSFMKVPPAQGQPYAVAGLAWGAAATNRPGARFGPLAIRQSSHVERAQIDRLVDAVGASIKRCA